MSDSEQAIAQNKAAAKELILSKWPNAQNIALYGGDSGWCVYAKFFVDGKVADWDSDLPDDVRLEP